MVVGSCFATHGIGTLGSSGCDELAGAAAIPYRAEMLKRLGQMFRFRLLILLVETAVLHPPSSPLFSCLTARDPPFRPPGPAPIARESAKTSEARPLALDDCSALRSTVLLEDAQIATRAETHFRPSASLPRPCKTRRMGRP